MSYCNLHFKNDSDVLSIRIFKKFNIYKLRVLFPLFKKKIPIGYDFHVRLSGYHGRLRADPGSNSASFLLRTLSRGRVQLCNTGTMKISK